MIYVGSLYITGNMAPYFQSYFKVSDRATSVILPMTYVGNSIFLASFGRLTQRNINPKYLIVFGSTMSIALMALATNMKSYWLFIIPYVLSLCLVCGFCYLVTMHHNWLWYRDRPGLASGICFGGYGIGSLVYNSFMTPVLNPMDDSFTVPCKYATEENPDYGCYPDSVNLNFKHAMYLYVVVSIILALFGVIFVW